MAGGTRPQDTPRRIRASQEALSLIDHNTQPQLRAQLQVNLSVDLIEYPLGKRAENLEQAIRLCQPNQSGLLLHDGFLTVQRIITDLDLKQTHLTALASGRSGRAGITLGEELVGLAQAVLIAGSKSVVAMLWCVNESTTQAFFQHFYRAIKAGHSPAAVLTRPNSSHPSDPPNRGLGTSVILDFQ